MMQMLHIGKDAANIEIVQASKNLWTVQGTYRGASITVSAANRRTAVNRWRKAAEAG
jgi:hypothetical protein